MKSFMTGLIGSGAVVLLGAFGAISVAALLGLAATPDSLRVGVAAVAAIVLIALPKPDAEWHRGAWCGIGLGLLLIAAGDVIDGVFSLGAGQTGAVIGATVAIPVLHRLWNDGNGDQTSRLPRLLFGVVGVLVAVALIRAVIEGGGLGHDESAYALKTRSWLFGTPDSGWQLHRAPLVSVLAIPVIAFTENEVAIRAIGVVLAILALVGAGLVAHRLSGWWALTLTAATVGASLEYLRRGSEFLTDIPSAGLLLIIVWMVLGAVRRPENAARTVIAIGPVVALAFYMRYQSVLAVAGVALGAAIVWPAAVRQLKRPILIASGIALAAIVPHLIWATVVTGRPWGIVTITQDAAGRQFLGEGLVDYAEMFPLELGGPGGAVLMAVAFGWILWALVSGLSKRSDDARLAGFVSIVVLVAVVPLGLVAHGEPRFVFFPVWLLVAVGSMAVVRIVSAIRDPYRAVLVVSAAILWLPLFTETVRRVDRNAEARGESFQVVVDASNWIENEAPGSCGVLTTYHPQVTWYSECWTALFAPGAADLGVDRIEGESSFALLFENGKRQPTGADAEAYLALGPTTVVPAANEAIGDATIVSIIGGR